MNFSDNWLDEVIFITLFMMLYVVQICSTSFASMTMEDDQHTMQEILKEIEKSKQELDAMILLCNRLQYAEFIHNRTTSELLREGDNGYTQPVVHNFANSSGTVEYYVCRQCSECGNGVQVLAPCQSRNDTVCGTKCKNPSLVYSFSSKVCHSVASTRELRQRTQSATITNMAPTSIAPTSVAPTSVTHVSLADHVATSDIQTHESTRECEHKDNDHDKKNWTPICVAIISLLLTLIFLVGFLLVQIKRKVKQVAFTESQTAQNNLTGAVEIESALPSQSENHRVPHIPNTSQEDRTPLRTTHNTHSTYHSTDVVSLTPGLNTAQTTGSTILPTFTTDIGINRIKESNLNQYVPTCPSTDQGNLTVGAINILQAQISIPQITVKPGTSPYWIEMSGYFGPQGGTLSCDQSDVVLEIPPGAIPESHPRQLVTVKVSLTPGVFSVKLEKEGLFLSPLVDCESPGLKGFKKDIIIKLPHRAHFTPVEQFVVHYTEEFLSHAGDRGSGWRFVKSSCRNERRDMQNDAPATLSSASGVQFTVDTKYVYITTPHFSKYTCSTCGKIRELSFEAVVYINEFNLDSGRKVDLHCYLLDSIKDFQRKVDLNEPYKQHTPHKPLIIDAKKGKEVELSLVDMGEDWSWEIDDKIYKATQVMNVDHLVRCHSLDLVPDFTTFSLRPRALDTNKEHQCATSSLETHVNIKQKSRTGKGITMDIAVDLDWSSTKTPDTRHEMEVGLMGAFIALSDKLTASQWKPLFRTLMTSNAKGYPMNVEAKISFIENKAPTDLHEQIYNGLIEWYLKCGKYATIQKLCDGLQKVHLEYVAAEIYDVYYQASGKVRAKSKLDKTSSDPLETTV